MRAPALASAREGSRISRGRSGCPRRRRAITKSAIAIAVQTTVMKIGNSSKNSTRSLYGAYAVCSAGTTSTRQKNPQSTQR